MSANKLATAAGTLLAGCAALCMLAAEAGAFDSGRLRDTGRNGGVLGSGPIAVSLLASARREAPFAGTDPELRRRGNVMPVVAPALPRSGGTQPLPVDPPLQTWQRTAKAVR